jgi:regulatory protein
MPAPPTAAERARERALRLLARREHSRAELRQRLRRSARDDDVLDAEALEALLDALAREGWLSETRFAEATVAARTRRGDGPLRLRARLAERGVAAELIDTALGAVSDWQDLLERARCKRFGDPAPQDYAQWAQQARYLQRRGFSEAQIRAALPQPQRRGHDNH